MKKVFILLTGWALWAGGNLLSNSLMAQAFDPSLLCQGRYYTETEGKAALEKFASTYSDRKSWEKRADRIRQGIWDGANLQVLPTNTPLKPIIHSKRTYDGYTV